MQPYLQATPVIERDHPRVASQARELVQPALAPGEIAQRLFYFVRDQVAFRPLFFNWLSQDQFRASRTLELGYGFCILKALLLIALLRSLAIPARLVLVEIRHHQLPARLKEVLGSDQIPHGYAEAWLGGRWVKLNPSYDAAYCRAMNYPASEFDGQGDALFPPLDGQGRPLIEYGQVLGEFDDLPYGFLMDQIHKKYGNIPVEVVSSFNKGQQYYQHWS